MGHNKQINGELRINFP